MLRHLSLLAATRAWLTVQDAFGAPGDTLLAATVCRIIKQRFPRIRINLATQWPDLIRHDSCLDAINAAETYYTLRFWYLETVARKEREQNVLLETLAKVGIPDYDYRARVYLTELERAAAADWLKAVGKSESPRLAFCSSSKEKVKNWPLDRWRQLLERLRPGWQLIHLGDDREPEFTGVSRFAGRLSKRESMAILSHCQVFAGPDSFLMHAANGLDVPSVIIFGGARPSACLGYSGNTNLYVSMACGPCWLHDSRGDICPHDVGCMKMISVEEVEAAIQDTIKRIRGNGGNEPPTGEAPL